VTPPAASGPLGAAQPRGIAAIRQALRYALAAGELVTPELFTEPTPCRGWDLRMLLLHAADSLSVLAAGLDDGRISLHRAGGDVVADPSAEFRQRARELQRSCDRGGWPRSTIAVGGCPMAGGLLAMVGAMEIAVHGWDISQACGGGDPIPAALAAELLQAAPLLVSAADRGQLFAAPVHTAPTAGPSDQLTAYLGRRAQAVPPPGVGEGAERQ
jgi:uncharacterized protein (TIGR03086 family)